MCRLFGFRSVIQSQVHRSLLSAENALVWQSERHPDGWGVAYYVENVPHVIKSASTAITDRLFRRVSGIVSSQTVIAHLRKATQGEESMLNSHPFQYGNWIFAHNGDIPNFDEIRGQLVAEIPPELRRFILGDTDSEVIFYLMLGKLAERIDDLHQRNIELSDLTRAARETIELLQQLSGIDPYQPPPVPAGGGPRPMYLSFVITNGRTMLGHQGGKELYYSTYKVCCPERDTCPCFSPECEQPTVSGFVNHLVFSSEPLHGENVWIAMKPGDIIGVDWRMRLAMNRRVTPEDLAVPPQPSPATITG